MSRKIVQLSVRTKGKTEYVKAKADYGIEHETVTIHYPFERFYLEESKASEAERLYWEANSDSTQATYAVVRIKDGNAALQDVMINGESIISIIKNLEGESVKN